MTTTTNSNSKVLIWTLGAISSIASYVAIQQNGRIADLKQVIVQNDIKYNSERIDKLKVQREKDSLQALILERTDKSVTFEQLRKLIDIRNNKSTITIRPKK